MPFPFFFFALAKYPRLYCFVFWGRDALLLFLYMKSFCSINMWQETETPVFEPSSNITSCASHLCAQKTKTKTKQTNKTPM